MVSVMDFAAQHAELYNIPIYILTLYYVFWLIGWFFSTDYYDKVSGNADIEDLVAINVFFIIIISFSMFGIYRKGLDSEIVLTISTVLWVVFIVPHALIYIFKCRSYLRAKRGKS